MRTVFLLLISITFFNTSLHAANVGDKAPAIDVAEWVGGKQPDLSEKSIRVVTFWATWHPHSPPILMHLSDLRSKFAPSGVQVIAISKEKPELVRDFLAKAALTCAVGLDREQATHAAFLEPQTELPVSVVIGKDNRIAWIGNPMQGLNNTIRKLVAGTFSPQIGQRVQELQKQLQQARNPEDAFKIIDEILQTEPDNHEHHALKVMILMRERVLDQLPKAYADWARGCEGNPDGLAALTMFLVRQTDLQLKNPPLALKSASRAYALSRGRNPDVVVAFARAVADTGLIEKAILLLDRAMKQGVESEDINRTFEYFTRLRRFQDETINILQGKENTTPKKP